MEIAFNSRELRALVESAKAMRKKFGNEAANSLMTLFSDLRAADSIYDLIDVDMTLPLDGARSFKIELGASVCVLAEANNSKLLGEDGMVAWDRVYMIKIMEIQYDG
jgi:hypothetical protein